MHFSNGKLKIILFACAQRVRKKYFFKLTIGTAREELQKSPFCELTLLFEDTGEFAFLGLLAVFSIWAIGANFVGVTALLVELGFALFAIYFHFHSNTTVLLLG